MKINNKRILITSLFVALLAFIIPKINHWYDNNLRDHTEILKKIGTPMQEYVLAFYKESQRYPSFEELIGSLKKLDCNNIRQKKHAEDKNRNGEVFLRRAEYDCDYGSMTLEVYMSVTVFTSDYGERSYMEDLPVRISLNRGSSYCNFFLIKHNSSEYKHSCYNDTRLIKHWGH